MGKFSLFLYSFFLMFNASAQEYNYIHYTTKDGLAGNTVYGVAQDNDGYMFFATENGLSRFDGNEWKTFTVKDGLPDNEVLTIFCDSKGRVWMGQYNKTLCYYSKGIIHNSTNDTLLKKIKLNAFISRMHEIENGDMVFSNPEMVFSITHDYKFFKIIEKKITESLKFGTELLTIKCLADSGSEITYDQSNYFLYKNYKLQRLTKMQIINLNKKLPLYKFLRDTRYYFKSPIYKTKSLIINSYDYQSKSQFYVNTLSGTWQINSSNMDSNKHFLAGIKTGHTLEDREGNYWFSTLGNGVYKTASDKMKTYTAPDKGKTANKDLLSIGYYDNSIIGGASFGKLLNKKSDNFLIFDFQDKIKYSQNSQDLNRATSSTQINNYTSIIGFDSYLLKLQNNQPSFNYDVMPVKSVEKIDDNNVIVATGNHCYKIRVSDLKITDTIWNDRTTYAFSQNNQYYIGTLTGLYIVDAQKTPIYLGNLHPALQRRIVCIKATTDGTLYVATADAGVVVLKANKVVKFINDENGLRSNSCKTLHISNNFLWVGTINGITKIDLTEKNKVVHYSTGDGLPSNIINAIYVDNTDSTVWVGSSDGLTSFKEKDLVSTSICNLVMQSITVSNNALAIDSNNYYLKYIDNNIRFQFVGISFRSGDDITYSYMLKGLDKNWHQTKERNLSYPTLESGDYTLLLYATNKFGVVSKTIQINFTIETAFWETLWFKGLIGLLVIAAIYFFLKRRFDKAKKVQAEKALVKQQLASMEQLALQAQMNPHFIFNCLNSIQQFTMHDDKEKANKYLTDFAILVRTTLDNSGKKNITIAEEALYLGRYLELEQLRFGDSFSYDITIEESVDKDFTKMPAMLLQPYVENSLRHGIRLKKESKGNVKIVFYEKDNYLICSVKDNGVGRAASAKAKTGQHIEYQSRGMELTAKRIELLNTEVTHKASVAIIDLVDDNNIALGTEVVLKIPLEG